MGLLTLGFRSDAGHEESRFEVDITALRASVETVRLLVFRLLCCFSEVDGSAICPGEPGRV